MTTHVYIYQCLLKKQLLNIHSCSRTFEQMINPLLFFFILKCLLPLNTFILLCIGDSGGGISRDEYISQVARDIQSKLPEAFDLDVIRKKMGLEISPTSVVLLQELERFNKLTLRMRRSLAELQRVSDIKTGRKKRF